MDSFFDWKNLNEGRGYSVERSAKVKKINPEIFQGLATFSEEKVIEIFQKVLADTKKHRPNLVTTDVRMMKGEVEAIERAFVSSKPVRLQVGEASHAFYASFYDRDDLEKVRAALNSTFNSLLTGGNPNAKIIEAKVSDRLDFFDIWHFNRIGGGKGDEIVGEYLHEIRGVIASSQLGII